MIKPSDSYRRELLDYVKSVGIPVTNFWSALAFEPEVYVSQFASQQLRHYDRMKKAGYFEPKTGVPGQW